MTVDFGYEPRPDPFSTCRAGFEIRTMQRCRSITVAIMAGAVPTPERTYHLRYADPGPMNSLSLLESVALEGQGSGGSGSRCRRCSSATGHSTRRTTTFGR